LAKTEKKVLETYGPSAARMVPSILTEIGADLVEFSSIDDPQGDS